MTGAVTLSTRQPPLARLLIVGNREHDDLVHGPRYTTGSLKTREWTLDNGEKGGYAVDTTFRYAVLCGEAVC